MDNNIPWWNINIDNSISSLVKQAIDSKKISQGSLTKELEQELAKHLNVPYVVCTTSGTVALLLAYIASGLRAGDEIITCDRTWIATANSALVLGAKVKVVDCIKNNQLIDTDKIEKEITPKTKLVVPVHMNGDYAFSNKVNDLIGNYDISIVEDSCQAFMSQYQGNRIGYESRFSCYSFGMAKMITSGQGGFITCHDKEDQQLLFQIRDQGLTESKTSIIDSTLSGNFKFTDIQAAMLLPQLSNIDKILAKQQKIYNAYQEDLKSKYISIPIKNIKQGCTPLRVEATCPNPDKFIAKLKEFGVECKRGSLSLSQYPLIQSNIKDFPNSEFFSNHLITLPSGPGQSMDDIYRVIDIINDIFP